MKISKKQLRKMIKEEKAKLNRRKPLRETVGDLARYQDKIEEAAEALTDLFYDDMMNLFKEDPSMFDGRSTEMEWEQQVVYAQQEMETGIAHAIEKKIEEIEMQLHDGQYHDDRSF